MCVYEGRRELASEDWHVRLSVVVRQRLRQKRLVTVLSLLFNGQTT